MCKTKANRKSCTRLKIVAIILAAIAVGLIIVSFFTPPMFIIDGSVIAAVGEIFAFVSLFFAWESVDRGLDAKFEHKGMKIEIENPDS